MSGHSLPLADGWLVPSPLNCQTSRPSRALIGTFVVGGPSFQSRVVGVGNRCSTPFADVGSSPQISAR